MNFFSIKAFIKVELSIQKKRAINKVFSGLQIAFLCNPFAQISGKVTVKELLFKYLEELLYSPHQSPLQLLPVRKQNIAGNSKNFILFLKKIFFSVLNSPGTPFCSLDNPRGLHLSCLKPNTNKVPNTLITYPYAVSLTLMKGIVRHFFKYMACNTKHELRIQKGT